MAKKYGIEQVGGMKSVFKTLSGTHRAREPFTKNRALCGLAAPNG